MTSPSIYDGYRGAGDAATLDRCDRDGDICHVQHVTGVYPTTGLLSRAGITNPTLHEFYPVRIITDKFNRLQIAP